MGCDVSVGKHLLLANCPSVEASGVRRLSLLYGRVGRGRYRVFSALQALVLVEGRVCLSISSAVGKGEGRTNGHGQSNGPQ